MKTRRHSTKQRYAIFHLDSERGFRGGERQLLYLAGYLRQQGHENIVVCRKGEALDQQARQLGFTVLHLPFLGEWDPLSAARLRRAVSRAGLPAILHAHTAHTAALASLVSRWGGPPWVAHRRVDFALSGRLSARLKYGSAKVVVPVSASVADILERQGVPADRMRTIPDCIPVSNEEVKMAGLSDVWTAITPSESRPAKDRLGRPWNISAGAFWIGNIAALVPHKDQATLLKAFKIVLAQEPEARLFLIGEGPLRSALENLVRELDISKAVVFTGQQRNPIEWLGALDLFVLSSWGEGMGSVLLEALACRRPIVATTAGGIPEIIEHGKNGLLVPPRNPREMAKAMLQVLRNPETARKLAEHGPESLEPFRLGTCGHQMEECYDLAVLAKGNGHQRR